MIEIEERQRSAAGVPSAVRTLTPVDLTMPVPAGETPHAFLRRVTRPWHDGVEAAFERYDLQSFEGLSNFLMRQALALCPIEAALEAGGVSAFLPDWPQRRRAPLLRADLALLGLPMPRANDGLVFADGLPMLGALYVLEGSKLGGRVLHRRVLASDDARVRAADGFLGHVQQRGWASFLAVLDASPSDPASLDALAVGARSAFAQFHAAAMPDPIPCPADAPRTAGTDFQAHV